MVGKSLSNSQIKRRFQWANHQSKQEKFEQTTFVEGIRCIKVKSTWYWCVLCFVCVSIFTHTLHVCMFILFTGTYYFECISSWICWPRAMFSWSVHLEGETEHFWHCTTKHSEITIRCQLLRKAHAIYHCAWVMGPKGWKKNLYGGFLKSRYPIIDGL